MITPTQSTFERDESLEIALDTVRLLLRLTRSFYGNHREKQAMMQLIEIYITHVLDDDRGFDLTAFGRDFLDDLDDDPESENNDPPTPLHTPDEALH